MSTHTNPDSEIELLKLWESMFGNSSIAKAGNYTISYQQFIERTLKLKHQWQLEQAGEILRWYPNVPTLEEIGKIADKKVRDDILNYFYEFDLFGGYLQNLTNPNTKKEIER